MYYDPGAVQYIFMWFFLFLCVWPLEVDWIFIHLITLEPILDSPLRKPQRFPRLFALIMKKKNKKQKTSFFKAEFHLSVTQLSQF